MNRQSQTLLNTLYLTVLAVAILALYSSWGRPLWLDEYLHFVFGGFDTAGQAWTAVQGSTTNINHGQTGFYMMLDWALLKTFGANLFAMRIPSLISGALLLFSTGLFLRRKNLGTLAITAAFLLLAAQPNLMYFVGEARPYLPLVASSVAALAYFSSTPEQRKTPAMTAFIWITMIWGALMMPYYLLYLPVIATTCYLISSRSTGDNTRIDPRENTRTLSIRNFLTFINLPVQITSLVLGISISALTWLRGSPNFQRDPWLIIRPLVDSLTPLHYLAATAIAILIAVTIWLGRTNPLPALFLFAVMGAMAILFAVLSLLQSYWILPRQFVASQAIMTIAVVWAVSEALKNTPAKPQKFLAAIYAILIILPTSRATVTQIESLRDWENNGFPIAGYPGDAANPFVEIEKANQNVIQGGPVWPSLTSIYDEPRYGPGEDPRTPVE